MSQNLNNLLLKVHDKARHLAKDCKINSDLYRKDSSQQWILGALVTTLEQVNRYVNSLQLIQEQYDKLEKMVQKYQHDIRKHIALQQQIKIYAESIQQQLQDSQRSKIKLQSEKNRTIVQLTKINQNLRLQCKNLKQKMKINELKVNKKRSLQFKQFDGSHIRIDHNQSTQDLPLKNTIQEEQKRRYGSSNKKKIRNLINNESRKQEIKKSNSLFKVLKTYKNLRNLSNSKNNLSCNSLYAVYHPKNNQREEKKGIKKSKKKTINKQSGRDHINSSKHKHFISYENQLNLKKNHTLY